MKCNALMTRKAKQAYRRNGVLLCRRLQLNIAVDAAVVDVAVAFNILSVYVYIYVFTGYSRGENG